MPRPRTDARTEAVAGLPLYHPSFGDPFARIDVLRTHTSGSQETGSESSATSEWDVEFDLPISLLDRLLVSRIVSLEAKIKSIESWQRELEEAHSRNPRTVELKRRLALARETLSRQPSDVAVGKTSRHSPLGLLRRISERARRLSECAARGLQRSSGVGSIGTSSGVRVFGTLRTHPAKRLTGPETALER